MPELNQVSPLIKKAQRKEAYLKIGLSGPSGSGKTYSALLLAKGIMGGSLDKVVVIDTENGSANLYSQLGEYSVLPFEAPFGPERYVKAIDLCVQGGFQCIIIDSASHEWDGPGGCLDLHTKFGGAYQNWSQVTPLHQNFIESIKQAKAHTICTMRRKQDYQFVEKNGRMKVEKLGLKEIQREGFEYELTLNLNVNMDHLAESSKDRTGLFDGPPFMINEADGDKLRRWNLDSHWKQSEL